MRARQSRTSCDGAARRTARAPQAWPIAAATLAQQSPAPASAAARPAVKSVPNGNGGSSPCSAAGLSARAMRSGVLSRQAAGSSKLLLDLAGVLGLPQQFVLEARVRHRQHGGDHVAVGSCRAGRRRHIRSPRCRADGAGWWCGRSSSGCWTGPAASPCGVARSMMTERASSSAKPWATKLYCPPTPLTTRPSSSASETTAPSSVAIMALLMKRAFDPRAALGRLVAVELVDVGDRGHPQLRALGLRHLPQRAVERARAEEERRLQQRAVDLALEDAGAHEIEEAFDEHLAQAVEASVERRARGAGRSACSRAGSSRDSDRAKLGIAAVAQDQRLRHRIAERADADLQRAAVDDRARRMQAGGIFGEIDRLARRREQRKIGLRALQHRSRIRRPADRASPGMNGSSELTWPANRKSHAPAAARAEQIEREVGIAAQAEARLAVAHALRDQLRRPH